MEIHKKKRGSIKKKNGQLIRSLKDGKEREKNEGVLGGTGSVI